MFARVFPLVVQKLKYYALVVVFTLFLKYNYRVKNKILYKTQKGQKD